MPTAMMLNREKTKELGIIRDGDEPNFRSASYDLRIGTILAVRDGAPIHETGCYVLPPQGMVEVISWETIKVPPDIAGYASVKTSLSRDGLLALNTGILDPGFEGPLSATVVNFGKAESPLNRGAVFLRLTFHCCGKPLDFKPIPPVVMDKFLQERKERVDAYFSGSFLDNAKHVDELVRGGIRRIVFPLLGLVSLVALVVALVTFGVTLGVAYFQPYAATKDKVRSELSSFFRDEQFATYQERLADLEKKEALLESEAAASEHGASRTQTPNQLRRQGAEHQ
jgi:deoxycytidine triphosphate deaminase